jgi:hypothetical protein
LNQLRAIAGEDRLQSSSSRSPTLNDIIDEDDYTSFDRKPLVNTNRIDHCRTRAVITEGRDTDLRERNLQLRILNQSIAQPSS